jgi:hypothetical protein
MPRIRQPGSGHTDKATINARKRLTDEMRELLEGMTRHPIAWRHCEQGTKNRVRALTERGYADWADSDTIIITQAGRDALK